MKLIRIRSPPAASKLRVDNLHWDLTEDEIYVSYAISVHSQ
jgi:hypothetical protein